VADPEAASRAVAEAVSAWGRLDVCVHAAGTAWAAPLTEMPVERWRQVLETNLSAAFYLCRAAAPHLLASPAGRVIHLASIAGMVGQPPEMLDAVGYSASKGGLIAFSRDLAVKWAPAGVTVNVVAPGYFPTRLTEGLLAERAATIRARIPMGRLGEPDDLGGVAVLLASDAGRYVTGQVIAVDGGLSAS
jgi:NAD(P)-dependent dehydrogenase (short-subunit alcohol dehydrogenase family)